MLAALQFLWSAMRGHRLRPWRSLYLRWRMETYSGLHAETMTARQMVQVVWRDRRQFLRFLHWTTQMRKERGRAIS